MKRIISFLTIIAIFYSVSAGAQNFSHYQKTLEKKKINSTIEHTSKASNNSNSQPVNNGGLTITVNNSGQSFNTFVRTVNFSNKQDVVVAQCNFVRIKTKNKSTVSESFVDTDNPFERPAALEKLGERYDNLVKDKSIYTISASGVKKENGSEMFLDYWNQVVPFISLDSLLNCIVFKMPAAQKLAEGTAWKEDLANSYITIKNTFKITKVNENSYTVECIGNNTFAPDPAFENSNAINLKIQRLTSNYAGTIVIDKSSGLVLEANFEATTTNRKNIMGQKIDSERKETIKIINKVE